MTDRMTLKARYNKGRWELRGRAHVDNWGDEPLYFKDLDTMFVHGPHLMAEDDGMSEEDARKVRAIIEFDDRTTCPVGRRGTQVLCEVNQERAPRWHEPLVEYAVTIGHADGPFVAIHQVSYGEDGHHRFNAVQLPIEVATWAADHLAGLAQTARSARGQSRST